MMLRILALLLAFATAPIAHAADDLLDVEKAFALTARALDDRTLELNYKIAKGYYLYRERFEFKADGATLGAADIPPGKRKKDEFFGMVETYRDGLRLTIPIAAADGNRLKLHATSQGCADAGVCYPPTIRTFTLTAGAKDVRANELAPVSLKSLFKPKVSQ